MFSIKSILTGLVAGSLLVLGAGVSMHSALAQTDVEPFSNVGTDDDGASLFGDSSDPFELIHRAISVPGMSSQEFLDYQDRAIGSEAQDFRQRQQELLRQQSAQPVEAIEEITVDDEEI
ncbi:MAG: hypothetical protein F6K00_23555 [Leptolyngbya sp. SIOISBB]|nr:hypothetical protein [Leptolyngbya sp. SIOISBB]